MKTAVREVLFAFKGLFSFLLYLLPDYFSNCYFAKRALWISSTVGSGHGLFKVEFMSERYFSYELTNEILSAGDMARFYKRTRLKPPARRRFSESDIREILLLCGSAASTLFPVSTWTSFNRFTSSIRYRHHRKKNFARFAKSMRSVFSINDEEEVELLFRSHLRMTHRRRHMLMVDILAQRRNPKIDFSGADLLRDALKAGKGAIVWAFQFEYQALAGKRALREQGFEPLQVSVDSHGFSDTAFGNATINRLLRSAENKYLKQRVVFDRSHGASVMGKIISLLEQGELIILTNNVYAGNMFVEMPFGEAGYVSMPTSPLSIATRRNTPIFSMSILETEPLRRMEATVEPLNGNRHAIPEDGTDKRDYARMARLALDARDHLFRQCQRAPDQFLVAENLAASRFE
ncbi:hypothetical protein [Hoeflea prorocentri]|uniref:hypothetical protein n=1 Tax=Hoeflea prorocentri TaxID=1922333 RepID=UPI00227CA24B|nr:hypothetical protein [Hoeflea prorocentri]MCY6383472.1 hypothetical protein [Hoeflea prorocentri]